MAVVDVRNVTLESNASRQRRVYLGLRVQRVKKGAAEYNRQASTQAPQSFRIMGSHFKGPIGFLGVRSYGELKCLYREAKDSLRTTYKTTTSQITLSCGLLKALSQYVPRAI